MRVVILTNDDLTGNIIFSHVTALPSIEVPGIIFSQSPAKNHTNLISASLSLMRRMDFRYWMFLVLTNGLFRMYSIATNLLALPPSFGVLHDLSAHAKGRGTPVLKSRNFNSEETKALLRSLRPDLLLVRVSTILDAEVLAIPRLGTWCIHSSLLPAYGGIAGEFQALRENQTRIGSTVFEVTSKVDKGPPLGQVVFDTEPYSSLFWHVIENNVRAGQLVSDMTANLARGMDHKRPLLNEGLLPSYYSWPNRNQVTEYLARGRRLLGAHNLFSLLCASIRFKRPIFR